MTSLQDLITQTETALTNLESHFQREAQFMSEANDRFSKNIAAFEQYFPRIVAHHDGRDCAGDKRFRRRHTLLRQLRCKLLHSVKHLTHLGFNLGDSRITA